MQRPADAAALAAGISHLRQILPRSCGSPPAPRSRRISTCTKRRRIAAPMARPDGTSVMSSRRSFPVVRCLKAAAAAPALSLPGLLRRAVADDAALHSRDRSDLRRSDLSPRRRSRATTASWCSTRSTAWTRRSRSRRRWCPGHVVSSDDRHWDLTLRDGLLWHDGERVLARDCVASIRRWAARDGFGAS